MKADKSNIFFIFTIILVIIYLIITKMNLLHLFLIIIIFIFALVLITLERKNHKKKIDRLIKSLREKDVEIVKLNKELGNKKESIKELKGKLEKTIKAIKK